MKIDYDYLSQNISFEKCLSDRWWTTYTLELRGHLRLFGTVQKGASYFDTAKNQKDYFTSHQSVEMFVWFDRMKKLFS